MKPFLIFTLTVACSSNDKSGGESVAAKTSSETPSGPDKAAAKPVQKKPFDPLAGKSLAEICESDSLALIKWSYDTLASDYNSLCCTPKALGSDHERCILDWPTSDVPSCSLYDDLRNSIYARYGYTFKSKRWQKTFSKKTWYIERDDYSKSWLSKKATANIASLKKMKENKDGCMD